MTKCASRSILRASGLSQQSEPSSLTDLAVDALVEPAPLPPILTDWYKARKELGNLPEKLPPLPPNILEIIQGKCPIYDNKKKPDGTHYTIGDTHVLQLLCKEDGSLNQFGSVVRTYGETKYSRAENPLQFRYFWDDARQEHGATLVEPTHWELTTKDVLPGSRNKTWQKQLEVINDLSQKAFVLYEAPSLKNASRTLFLHKVATGMSLYIVGNEQNADVYTYTCVQETTREQRLVVGGSAPSGVRVLDFRDFGGVSSGVGALRKFL